MEPRTDYKPDSNLDSTFLVSRNDDVICLGSVSALSIFKQQEEYLLVWNRKVIEEHLTYRVPDIGKLPNEGKTEVVQPWQKNYRQVNENTFDRDFVSPPALLDILKIATSETYIIGI